MPTKEAGSIDSLGCEAKALLALILSSQSKDEESLKKNALEYLDTFIVL